MNTILIVEDEENNMKLATDLLTMHGYRVLQAWSGEDAVKIAREKQPNIILMDVEMPGGDGMQAMSILKSDKVTSQIKVIIVTAKAMRGDEEMILAAGADYYLAKPYQYQDLLEVVIKCANSELSTED